MTGWDCHAHLFGPYVQFPLAGQRSYTPPEATRGQYLAMLERLGLSHGVLVHPSAYGDDFSLLFDALAAQPQLRGVVVTRDATVAQMKAWRAHGVRGARFSHRSGPGANFAGSALLDDLLRLADFDPQGAFAAVGSQQTSLAGALTGETHMRTTWTVTGFTSVTFIVAAGVTTT